MWTILDLCGGTGAWSKPYQDAGYDVQLITLPDYDARLFPSKSSEVPRLPNEFESIEDLGRVHGVLAAPPCTYFAGSGATWKRTDDEIIHGLSIVDACLRIIHVLKPSWWVLENPVGKLRKWLGPPKMSFQPCDYGDPYTKRTLLWGNFNTNLKKNPVEPEYITLPDGKRMSKMHHDSFRLPKDKRSEVRSITPPGFARAFMGANP